MLKQNLRKPGWSALLALSALTSLVWGIVVYGLGAAVNQARPTIHLLSVVAFLIAVRRSEWQRTLLVTAHSIGLVLVVAAMFAAATKGIGDATALSVDPVTGEATTQRILVAGQAFAVLLAALAAIALYEQLGKARYAWSAGLFLATVLVAQHRTVWVALMAAIAALLLSRHRAAAARVLVPALALASVGLTAVLVTNAGSIASKLTTSAASASDGGGGTFIDRREGWTVLLSEHWQGSYVGALVGEPFGAPYDRIVNGVLVTYGPHNFYVATYLRMGAVAVVALVVLLFSLAGAQPGYGKSAVAVAVAVASATYGLAYSVEFIAAPLLALLLTRMPIEGEKTQGSGPEGLVIGSRAGETIRANLATSGLT